jgi:hypothetical protein
VAENADDLGIIALEEGLMGGPGSGNNYHWHRPSKKTVVEDCQELDASRLMREGILASDVRLSGSWRWYNAATNETTSSIAFEVCTLGESAPWLRLFYTFKAEQKSADYRVSLTTTRPRFGGLRWWFICPLIVNGRPCGQRVGKLYLPPGGRYFGCRRCHSLTYTSCQESHKYDRVYRMLAADMGCDPKTVKWAMDSIGKR